MQEENSPEVETCPLCLDTFDGGLRVPVRFGKGCSHILCLQCAMKCQDASYKKVEIFTVVRGVVPVLRKQPLTCPLCRKENISSLKSCFIPPQKIPTDTPVLKDPSSCPFCDIPLNMDRSLTRYVNYNNKIKHIQTCIKRPYECPRCGLDIFPSSELERMATDRSGMFERHIGVNNHSGPVECQPKKCKYCWRKATVSEIKKCEELHEKFVTFKDEFDKFVREMSEVSIALPLQDIFEMYKSLEDKIGDRRVPFDERKHFVEQQPPRVQMLQRIPNMLDMLVRNRLAGAETPVLQEQQSPPPPLVEVNEENKDDIVLTIEPTNQIREIDDSDSDSEVKSLSDSDSDISGGVHTLQFFPRRVMRGSHNPGGRRYQSTDSRNLSRLAAISRRIRRGWEDDGD